MHFLVALGIVLGPANTPVFVMRCPNVRKLQPRGRGHVVWKHAKNYACASFVLAIEGVGAPSFLRRYAADTVRGWFFFPVSRRVSRLVSGVSRENFNFCRKEKKNLIIQMYPCPNVLRNKCLVRNIQLAWNLRARRIKWNVRRYLWDIWRWDVRDNRDFYRVTCFPKDRRIS